MNCWLPQRKQQQHQIWSGGKARALLSKGRWRDHGAGVASPWRCCHPLLTRGSMHRNPSPLLV